MRPVIARHIGLMKHQWVDIELEQILQDSLRFRFQDVVPTPKIAEWEQIAVKIQEHLETVILGGKNLETAVRNLNRDTDKILEKRRWLIQQKQIQF